MTKKRYKYNLNKLNTGTTKKYSIIYGNYGIKSLEHGLINQKHVENVRRKLSKQFKKLNKINKTKIYIRLLYWKPYTKKPLLSRMGKGAGNVAIWKTLVKKGHIILELSTVEVKKAVYPIVTKAIKTFPLKLVVLNKY